nr:hypothetical protein BaRGS_029228 [Batillaria attramentaria]
MDRAGRVEWKGGNQSVVCSWLIDVDLQYGIVLQFLALSLQRGDTRDKDDSLTVYRGHQPDKGERLRRVVDSRQFVASLTSLAGYDEVFMDTFKPAFNDLRDYMHRFVGSDLLRSNVYRVCLWFFSLLAILGNTGVLIYRLCLEVEGSSSGFRLLVANLCGSDFLMGVYLLIIGSADSSFSEVSAFIICFITLDRLLVLRFPLKRHLHLTWQSTMMACGAAWMTGFVLAMVPLLPPTGWEFYSQNGICLPLPITRPHFPGKHYSYGVFIVLNFVLFLMIGFGQIFIYRAVRNTPMADRTHRRQQDMAIARRLSLIVFSDFCCWFPVGVMGLLASQGTPIAGEYNVLAAIFVMPLNSAINPFLYTLNTLLERQRKRRNGARIERLSYTEDLKLPMIQEDEKCDI